MWKPTKSLVGETYNRLTILSERQSPDKKYILCEAQCTCGNVSTKTRRNEIVSGKVQSCGCLRKERCAEAQARRFDPNAISKSVAYQMLARAKNRALRLGLDFDLELSDIVIPEVCPLLGIPLIKGDGVIHDNSPSLDRKRASGGYTKDNIWVISHLANKVKNNTTSEVILQVGLALQKEGL